MSWDAIGAVGQVLGSVAVFVTLGYLAVQVRHARGEVRRSISQNRSEAARQLSMFNASDERICRIIVKAGTALGAQPAPISSVALVEGAGLTNEEAFTFHFVQQAWWQYRSQVIENVNELPSGKRIEFDLTLKNVYGRLPAVRLWYEASKSTLDPDAVHYIDNLLAQPATASQSTT